MFLRESSPQLKKKIINSKNDSVTFPISYENVICECALKVLKHPVFNVFEDTFDLEMLLLNVLF